MYAKWILKQENSVARRDLQYIFALLHFKQNRAIENAIYPCLYTSNRKLTAGQLLNEINNNEKQLEHSLSYMMTKIRGSIQYWNNIRKDLNVFNEKLGPATFFLTLSCAEYSWTDMKDFFKAWNSN